MNYQNVRTAIENAHFATELRLLQFNEESIKRFLAELRSNDLKEMIEKYQNAQNDYSGDADE